MSKKEAGLDYVFYTRAELPVTRWLVAGLAKNGSEDMGTMIGKGDLWHLVHQPYLL